MEDILEPSLEEELNNIKVLIKEPKRKYHDFWTSLFRNNNGLIDKINKEIPKDSDSWELWYLLFLAENNNLINLNPDNIRHKAAFKTAYELANANDKAFMDLELELYSNVKNIKGLDVILRSYQFGALEQILTNLVILIDNNKIEQDCHKLLKPLDTLFNMSDSVIKTNIQIIIINALFIKLGYPELEKMFNERINSEIYLGSKLGIKYICYTEKELESYMTYEKIFTALEGAKSGEEEINMYNKSTYNPLEKQVVKRPKRYLTSEEKFKEGLIEEVSGYYSFRFKIFLILLIANVIFFLVLLLFFGIMKYIS